MEGQRYKKKPLTRVAFVYNGPKGMELAPNPRYRVMVLSGPKESLMLPLAVDI